MPITRYAGVAALVVWFSVAFATTESQRPWTVEDSIAVRYFVAQAKGQANGEDGFFSDPVNFSPDRRYFFFVTRRGDLPTDRVVGQLQVFSATEVLQELARAPRARRVPAPIRSIQMQSAWSDSYHPPISEAYWEDEEAIVFVGVQDNEPRRIFRLNVRSGELQALTPVAHETLDLSMLALRGTSVVYQVLDPRIVKPLDQYPMAIVAGDELKELLSPSAGKFAVYAAYQGREARRVATLEPGTGLLGNWISPDGRWALAVFAPEAMPVPPSWSAYERGLPRDPYRFMLIDVVRGTSRPVFDAPIGTVTQPRNSSGQHSFDVFWSQDSRHALLVNTALPLDGIDERRATAYIVDLEMETGRWMPVAALRHEGSKHNGARYRFDGTQWRVHREPAPKPSSQVPRLTVELSQTLNDPPRIVASYGREQMTLTSPDPALKDIARPSFEPVSWKEQGGHVIPGQLLLPGDNGAAKPYPLVIQAFSGEIGNFFRPDGGCCMSAYAAQALAAQGMAVLLIDIPGVAKIDGSGIARAHEEKLPETPRELEAFVERVDTAVESLAARRLIDATRVGLVGFSRGGYLSYYAITHPGKTKLAAAVIADAFTGSYSSYVIDAATSSELTGGDNHARFDQQYGGGPFWQNKSGWMEHVPEFNLDRMRVPALFSLHGKISKVFALETVGALRISRRPFEYLYFSAGSHNLQRPRERLASLTATVDWMNFWLRSKLPPEAARRERWQAIRSEWEQTLKGLNSESEGARAN
jgi:hypothetical protein